MTALPLSRRQFLRAAGISIALPLLESWPQAARAAGRGSAPYRMVCVGNEFGMVPDFLWPQTYGRDYQTTPVLEPLRELRNDFTLFAHLDHGLKGGHFAIHGFLTGIRSTQAPHMAEGGISLDQRAAEPVGTQTRFPSLAIGSEDGIHGGCMMSWTRSGTRVPPISGPRELFRMLFIDNDDGAKRQADERIARRTSILDAVVGDAKSLQKRVSRSDGDKLNEYFTAVREVEKKLDSSRRWQLIPKPRSTTEEPIDEGLAMDLPKIYDLLVLALQTDSTRVVTIEIGGSFLVSDLGIDSGYHGLSHHGHLQKNLDRLLRIERYQLEQFGRFLGKLKAIREPGTDGTLLDRTLALHGSGMGNANAHTNSNLPIILAGGGFRHGEYKAHPEETAKRVPLCNLFLSMLQRFGVETDQFSTSTGTLTGLDVVG